MDAATTDPNHPYPYDSNPNIHPTPNPSIMKTLFTAVLGTVFAFALSTAQAEEKTYEGEMSCAKCNLKQADKCEDTLKVGDTLYLLEEGGKRKTSEHVCSGAEKAKVTGKIEERDGKKYLVASKIELE